MKDTDLLEVFATIHRIFPLPTEDPQFRGTHGFTVDRESGRLELGIWYWSKSQSKVMCRSIFFENEELTEALFEEIRAWIDKDLQNDEVVEIRVTTVEPQ